MGCFEKSLCAPVRFRRQFLAGLPITLNSRLDKHLGYALCTHVDGRLNISGRAIISLCGISLMRAVNRSCSILFIGGTGP